MSPRPSEFQFAFVIVVLVLVSLVPILSGQSARPSEVQTAHTPWGDPNLQGVWSSDSATPLERPARVADREFLTDEEVALLKRRAEGLFNTGDTDAAFGDSVFESVLSGDKGFQSTDTTGNYNQFWLIDRWFENRTSLIVDPPNGRVPPLTPEAQVRKLANSTQPDGSRGKAQPGGPEDFDVGLRCTGSRIPMMTRGYNSTYQIVQAPGYVVINMEMMHDARIIPLDGRPHVSSHIRGYRGDSRGRWEGDTLVVETTNLRRPDRGLAESTGERLFLIERFSLVDEVTLRYEFTVQDPTTWTEPWTAVIFMKPTPGTGLIYEYACHEGNYAIANSLRGARTQERATVGGSR